LRFKSPPLWGLGTTYDIHPELIRKSVVDFLLVLIEHFSLRVAGKALWAKIDRKLAISVHTVSLPKISDRRVAPPLSFLHG